MRTVIKQCKKHGMTDFSKRKEGGTRCKKCAVESVVKRTRNKKLELIKMFGNKCQECGYNKSAGALQFHHLNPKEKSFGIAEMGKYSLSRLIEEAKKCVLLCANCHAENEYTKFL